MQYDLEILVREFLCKDQKILGLVQIIKPLGLIAAIARGLDLRPRDAADVTFELIKRANPNIDLEKYVNEGIPLVGPRDPGQFPIPNKLKKDKKTVDEMSPLRGEPEFIKHQFPPEKHRKMPSNFPYDSATVRWSRVRGTTPRSGHLT